MNDHDLLEAIGNIDEKYIKEADLSAITPLRRHIKQSTVAAAASVLTVAAALALPRPLPQKEEGIQTMSWDSGDVSILSFTESLLPSFSELAKAPLPGIEPALWDEFAAEVNSHANEDLHMEKSELTILKEFSVMTADGKEIRIIFAGEGLVGIETEGFRCLKISEEVYDKTVKALYR